MSFEKIHNEDGASAVEYGLLLAFIAVLVAAAVAGLGPIVSQQFDETETAITNAGG